MKRFVLPFFFIFIVCVTHGQQKENIQYPKIGEVCPSFILPNILYYERNQASLQDFKGKWLVLDFWNKYCHVCVASFPKVSSLQKKFGGKVQFMMVGIEDPENEIATMYKKYWKKEKLTMPCAIDSLVSNNWGIYSAPHIIIIDDKSVVQGITSSVDSEQVQSFLDGKRPILASVYDPGDTVDHRIPFIAEKPFLSDGNGGKDSDFLFRSVLSKFNSTQQKSYFPFNVKESVRSGMFQVLGVPLYALFNYAYFGVWNPSGYLGDSTRGKYHILPVLELHDSSLFNYSFNHGRNLFAYSLIMPPQKASEEGLKRTIQDDLQRFFGFETNIEVRKFPFWRLVTTDKVREKLKTKGGKEIYKATKNGFVAKNFPFESLLNHLYFGFQEEIIVDETGIKGNIDISMEDEVWPKEWISFQDARKAFHECGLDLVPDEKEMKVLVIHDKIVPRK